MKIAVIGIGQSMRGDDAAGLEAVRRWREIYKESAGRPEVSVEASGLPGLNLLDLFTEADSAILVDAVRSSAPPGTIHRLTPTQLSAFAGAAQSAHGWGVAETLALAEELKLPARDVKIRIIGIEACQMELGSGLSQPIQEIMPFICAAIEETLQELLN
jgi:hydrogenase maturation protease